MARKNVLAHKIAEAQSLVDDFTTEPTVIQFLDSVSYQINVTTTNSEGIFIIQASNDYVPEDPTQSSKADDGNWVDLALTGVPTVAAADDSIMVDLNQLPYKALRLKYTSSVAGTGTCEILINARQLGG